jgi:hypothetical protein
MRDHLLLAPLLESYFRRRLTKQRNATPATVTSYRDALRMLILFAAARLRRKPAFDGALYVFRAKRAQLVSLYVPLSDSGQPDHPIVLIINVVFRPTFDHALHRYADCSRRQRVDRDQPLQALDCLGCWHALQHQALC